MQSAYDDIVAALEEATFSIDNVHVREPFDESDKSYPAIIVHEIANYPLNHGTENGETRTVLAYELDIQTKNCTDSEGAVLTRHQAGRVLTAEVSDLLDELFKLTRRTLRRQPIGTDVLSTVWRGDCVLDSHGYTYRPK